MARPPIAHNRKSIRTSVMMPEDVHNQLQALAEANQVSSAWMIRLAVQRLLAECEGKSVITPSLTAKGHE